MSRLDFEEDIILFKKQINTMIDNLERLPKFGDVNVVFEGGAINGYYHIGVSLFLKELERRGVMRVTKVSGSSIGAYNAFNYLNDTIEESYIKANFLKESFFDKLNLTKFKESIINDVSRVNPTKFNGRLFISYYDVIPERKQVIQSEFYDTDDLCDALCSSIFLPVIIDGSFTYKRKDGKRECIDGGVTPYIFKNPNEKTLYVKLTGWNRIGQIFSYRGEKNGRGRVCDGIVSAYNFFLYGEQGSDICSWIENWNTQDHIVYKSKQIFYSLVSMIVCIGLLIWRWFISNNPGYDAIFKNLLSNNDISILMAIWQKIADILKDLILILVK